MALAEVISLRHRQGRRTTPARSVKSLTSRAAKQGVQYGQLIEEAHGETAAQGLQEEKRDEWR
jgi:hypothetical protein